MTKSIHVIIILAVIMAFLPAGSGQAKTSLQAGHPKAPAANQGDQVFLPLVQNDNAPQISSVELIDRAVKAGTISTEQGLIYKVFATFGDPRLPGQYVGSGIGREGMG